MEQTGLRVEGEPEATRVVGDGAAPLLRRLLSAADAPLVQGAPGSAESLLGGARCSQHRGQVSQHAASERAVCSTVAD